MVSIEAIGVARILIWVGSLLGLGLIGHRGEGRAGAGEFSKVFKKFSRKLSVKCRCYILFYNIFQNFKIQVLIFQSVWMKNTNCGKNFEEKLAKFWWKFNRKIEVLTTFINDVIKIKSFSTSFQIYEGISSLFSLDAQMNYCLNIMHILWVPSG